jgi:hypothetical protein
MLKQLVRKEEEEGRGIYTPALFIYPLSFLETRTPEALSFREDLF